MKTGGGLVETISTLNPKLSFKNLIGLKGYAILNYNEALIKNNAQLGVYISAAWGRKVMYLNVRPIS
ncbi:MAG: hypothetical protein IPM91_15335 [Bacteroidetes bacterium]|nr:hypothetical protein [Bacteroidota bacterium]